MPTLLTATTLLLPLLLLLLLLSPAPTTSIPLSLLLRRNPVQCSESPPTLAFGPYRTIACQQSFVPNQPNNPPIFNLTQNYCQDAPYRFGSYFAGAAEAAGTGLPGGCELAVYGSASCRGGVVVRAVEAFDRCVFPEVEGWSVMLSCPTTTAA